MNSSPALPQKEDLPKELWKVTTTLSDQAQNAALVKARELGFDLTKGRISLEETFINLSHNRDLLLDAVAKNKLAQLPLKLQYALLSQTQRTSEAINALVSGTDSLLVLEDATDELTSLIWQYNLHNLSDQVLGFHTKMNQLKAQETLIRRANREAAEFENSSSRAKTLLEQIEEAAKVAAKNGESIQASSDQVSAVAAKVIEQEQKVAGLVIQGQQHDSASAQFAANAKTAAADVEAIANKTRSLQTEAEVTKGELSELKGKVEQLLTTAEKTLAESLGDFHKKYEVVKNETQTSTSVLKEGLDKSIQELTATTRTKLGSALADIERQSSERVASISKLTADTATQLKADESNHEARLNAQIAQFTQKSETVASELKDSYAAKFAEIAASSEKVISANQAEHSRLVNDLEVLEGRIRESIERATGYTLFHSFQKRQLDLAKSKRFWGIALSIAVAISLCASAAFIYSLRYVNVYNAAFYLKLSISLPIIYAIAFCSVQYSRERRLEEEYAFKSNISISLDPYQKLVEQLIDKDKPEERAKYTAFVIDSVSRVFTSPTERIFEGQPGDKNSAEKIIKAVGDVIEPLAKALKK